MTFYDQMKAILADADRMDLVAELGATHQRAKNYGWLREHGVMRFDSNSKLASLQFECPRAGYTLDDCLAEATGTIRKYGI